MPTTSRVLHSNEVSAVNNHLSNVVNGRNFWISQLELRNHYSFKGNLYYLYTFALFAHFL
jgi:hypothetical protein